MVLANFGGSRVLYNSMLRGGYTQVIILLSDALRAVLRDRNDEYFFLFYEFKQRDTDNPDRISLGCCNLVFDGDETQSLSSSEPGGSRGSGFGSRGGDGEEEYPEELGL